MNNRLEATLFVIAAIILITAGLIIMFGLFRRDPNRPKKEKKKRKKLSESLNDDPNAKKTIGDYKEFYSGKKSNVVRRTVDDTKDILRVTGRTNEFGSTVITCGIMAGAGAILGIYMFSSVLVALILGFIGLMIPIWRLRLYRNKYEKYLTAQLESCVSQITASYLRIQSNDIAAAVKENLPNLSPLVRDKFETFVLDCESNPDRKNCVRRLRDSIDNEIFRAWCEKIISSIDDIKVKNTLYYDVEHFSTVKGEQESLDILMKSAVREYIIMMIASILIYPLIYFINVEWWNYYALIPGRIVVGITLLVLFYSINKLIRVISPVNRKKD